MTIAASRLNVRPNDRAEERDEPSPAGRNSQRRGLGQLADGRIAAALEQYEKVVTEATGEALGEIRAGLRVEFRKELEGATAKLGVDCAS
jgi:hypothetical protein